MLKHQKDYVEKDSDVKDKLKSASFVIDNKVTELGELFYDYVLYNREISRSVLGYFAEYKLYEYFIKSKKYKDVKHSYKDNGKKELDFVLDDEIIVEVKPMARFLYENMVDEIKNQIDGQLQQYHYKKHFLYLYTSYKNIPSKHVKISKNIKGMYNKLVEKYPNVDFKCFEVYWSLRKKDDNQYKTFIKQPLEDKNIQEVKIEEE